MQQSISFQQQQRSGRLKLLAIIAVFALPVVVAQWVLSQKLYQGGVTNQGDLITPYLSYSQLVDPNRPLPDFIATQDTWHMLYLVPEECGQLCVKQIEMMQASYELVGKDKPRVSALLIVADNSDVVASSLLPQQSSLSIQTLPNFDPIMSGQVVIVDKLGQWVMSFDSNEFESVQAMHKAFLSDLKKLLKLSRVG
jgi:hypothetical protein